MKKRYVLLLILLLVIGFASVSATLVLNGTIGIGLKNDDFEVIFVEALLDGQESSKATIGPDKKTITFSTDKLTNIGDTTELVYKVKNNSTQYGANVTMTCNTIGNEYVTITSTFNSQPLPLATPVLMEAQEVRMGRITAELKKGYAGEDNSISIECTITASATEEDKITNYVPYKYTEEILNGTDPVLANGLVPITIENDGTVKKADITSEWYSYENKKWANAIILEDESITYNAGETIPEGNIESYFVWIPKYSYQLWDLGEYNGATEINTGKVHTIPVKFGLTNTSDEVEGECTTPMNAKKTQGLSGESGNCQIGDYMTPPAFISMNSNGLWVGKFETGYKGVTSKEEAQVNTNDATKIEIKPNVYSWRDITVTNAYNTSYNYKRELDSHMMKNTEWGAVTYLQHSKYGSATSVRLNNNSAYITGYAAVKEPTCGYTGTNEECNKCEETSLGTDGTYTINYKNSSSQVASTTGNYTGIYDMSGGTNEYVMGVREDTNLGLMGLEANIKDKYYDSYNTNSSVSTFQYRILGDGTAEFGSFGIVKYVSQNRQIGSWHSDAGWYITSNKPWFLRGGHNYVGLDAGVFYFDPYNDNAGADRSFRIVLAP